MKLVDMTFEESRNAELIIVPEIEKIMADSEARELFDGLYTAGSDRDAVIRRSKSNKYLSHCLMAKHYESICIILGALNHASAKEIKAKKRGEVNACIAELFGDMDLVYFFMSSEVLDSVTQSDT